MQLNCRHNFISSFVESEAVCMCLQRTFFFNAKYHLMCYMHNASEWHTKTIHSKSLIVHFLYLAAS